MGADLRAKAHAIFTRVLSADSAAREAIILAECAGDAALEARVRRLVDAAAQSEGFLDKPALNAARQEWPPIPDAVGNYLVIGVLGVGGMATVYEAIQENPHRHVALKVMHQSLSHTDALLRFRFETQTLAKLRHPGIAQIYEAGAARLGRPTPSPFFAMELIPSAMSITQHAEHRSLPLRERLIMFASVCDAVLHGHQNGIIHRDIKPANVLVGPDGQAKVIDFGIARSMEGNAAALTGEGDTKRMIGTLNAMSPEQCLDPASIDVRSDVYSLGVLLYELVTGRLPHDLSQCSIPRAVQIITSQSPPLASTLRPEAAGDLDAIISKAMDHDRARRYPGAGALAADIRRFLNHQPIEARPATTLDRARKFAHRNPPLAVAIGAAILLLVGGTAISSAFAYMAARARDAALQRERELELITSFQESIVDSVDVALMGDRLRRSLEEAVRKALITDGSHASDASIEPSLEAWRTLVEPVNFTTLAVGSLRDGVLSRYEDSINDQFKDQPALRARLLNRLANTLISLGLHADAERPLRLALHLRHESLGPRDEETLLSAGGLGSLLSTLGRYDESLEILERYRAIADSAFGPDHRLSMRMLSSIAGVHRRRGNLAEAERAWTLALESQRRVLGPDHEDSIRTLNNIGIVYAMQGRLDLAESNWREVIERRRVALGEDHPDYLGSFANLGTLLQDQGRFEEARPLLERSLEFDRRRLGDAHPDTLAGMARLASLLQETGDPAGAETLQRRVVEGRAAALGSEHPETLRAHSFLAVVTFQQDRASEAEPMLRRILEAQRRLLGDRHSDTIETAASLRDLLAGTGRIDEALAQSTELLSWLGDAGPSEPALVGRTLSAHGLMLLLAGRPDEARSAMLEGYAMLEGSVGATHPQTRAAAGRLARAFDEAHARDPSQGHAAEADRWRALSSLSPPPRPKADPPP